MQHLIVLLGLTVVLTTPCLCAMDFVRTGDCENAMENRYRYEVEQSHFEEGNEQQMIISCYVTVTCETAGTYGGKAAHLYNMVVKDTQASGGIYDKENDEEFDIRTTPILNADDVVPTATAIPGIRPNSAFPPEIIDSDEDIDAEEKVVKSFDDLVSGWFKFVQTEDGAVPAVYHDSAEDIDAINFKKQIAAAFQANFKGAGERLEADPQSLHVAQYGVGTSSAQDRAQGIVRLNRRITSDNVKDYADHIPRDVVSLDRNEEIVIMRGIVTLSSGVTMINMVPKEDESVEGDSLEAQISKRDMDMSDYFDFLSEVAPESEEEEGIFGTEADHQANNNMDVYHDDFYDNEGAQSQVSRIVPLPREDPTYDPSPEADMPDIDANGKYSLKMVGQRRLLRQERSAGVNHLELPEATQSSLMANIDYTRQDMHRMRIIRSKLGNIHHVLEDIHKDPTATTSLVNNIEELLTLEAQYGPLSGYTPAINAVVDYLQQLTGSKDTQDNEMRALLYFMLSREGSLLSQKALLAALDSAIDEEEWSNIVTYIAFTENPQPQMISELEDRIGDDTHSTDPLLLAYGALVAKASPDLQQRMTLFLLSRLPVAETNSSSLIHHILSLGNTESHKATSSIIGYLEYPDHHVQLSSIYALRYATSDSLVQKTLTTFLNQSYVSDEHIATVLQCLIYGVEHALNNHEEKPFNFDLGSALLSSVMDTDNEELHLTLISYLKQINSAESRNLLKLMTSPSEEASYLNSTRLRRGTYWAASSSVYNLVSPLATRKKDLNVYVRHRAYIWDKKFGVKKGNVQVAAGGFIGVSKNRNYKIFGRAKAVGHAFGRTKTALDFLVLREKSSSSIRTRIYGEIVGKTLANIDIKSKSAFCKKYTKSLVSSRRYTLFNFKFSIFIYVGTLQFNLGGYVRLNSNLCMEFCEKTGSLTAEAGLVTTITVELQAGAAANLLSVARGGISVSAIFNYKLSPELSTEACFADNQFRVKNCIGIYHQWTNNRIVLDVWYQLRKVKWCRKWGVPYPCGLSWGHRRKWNALSTSWQLPSSPRKALYKRCDSSFSCNAVVNQVEAATVGGQTFSFSD